MQLLRSEPLAQCIQCPVHEAISGVHSHSEPFVQSI